MSMFYCKVSLSNILRILLTLISAFQSSLSPVLYYSELQQRMTCKTKSEILELQSKEVFNLTCHFSLGVELYTES